MKKGKEENFDANLELRDLTEKNGMKSNKQITDRNNSAADIANTEYRAQNIFSKKNLETLAGQHFLGDNESP